MYPRYPCYQHRSTLSSRHIRVTVIPLLESTIRVDHREYPLRADESGTGSTASSPGCGQVVGKRRIWLLSAEGDKTA